MGIFLFIIFSLFILLSSSKGNDDVGEGEGYVLTKNKHLLKPNSEKNDEEYVISKEKRKFNSELLKKLKFGRGNEDDDEDDGMFENDNFKEIQKALSRQTIRTESESGFSPVPEVSPSESMEAGYYNFLFYSSETDDMITEQANIIPIFYGCNSSVSDAFEDNTLQHQQVHQRPWKQFSVVVDGSTVLESKRISNANNAFGFNWIRFSI